MRQASRPWPSRRNGGVMPILAIISVSASQGGEMKNQNQVDCIVRFHDIRRLRELDRCIFSLLGQSYRPLNIILALKRFSAAEVAATREALAPMLGLPGAPKLTVQNLEQATPKNARSLLLNLGLQAVEGCYVGFLD